MKGRKRKGGGESGFAGASKRKGVTQAEQPVPKAAATADKRIRQEHRTVTLSRDTPFHHDRLKIKLQIARIQRRVQQLRDQLRNWDPVQAEESQRQRADRLVAVKGPEKRKGRQGPQSWKVKGAARPANEVYEFDTRHVDTHAQAHERARLKQGRIQNLLQCYQGKIPEAPEPCREYLGLLMELGCVCRDGEKFQAAQEAWTEVMTLEGDGHSLTTARENLMQMHMDTKRYDLATKLGNRFAHDDSVYLRYSAALASFLQDASDAESSRDALERAIRCSIFCAYYLAYYDIFEKVMEYTDDLQHVEEAQTSLEEAIEYGSQHGGDWKSCRADQALRRVLGSVDADRDPTDAMSDWKARLRGIEAVLNTNKGIAQSSNVDRAMYVEMFKIAMEMVEESSL